MRHPGSSKKKIKGLPRRTCSSPFTVTLPDPVNDFGIPMTLNSSFKLRIGINETQLILGFPSILIILEFPKVSKAIPVLFTLYIAIDFGILVFF